MTDEPGSDLPQTPAPHRHWYRLALGATILLVLVVVALLPIAVRSMQEVLGRGADPVFDLVTGRLVAPEAAASAETDATYVNLGIVALDETTGQVSLAVSGNRSCANSCAALALTFSALDKDANQRRGLPPSAPLTIPANDPV